MLQSLLRPTYMVGLLWDGIRGAYSDINPATLTGAIDVIVVKQPDDTYQCGPFHVRFGKMGAFRPNDLLVDIYINGRHVEDLHMRLGAAGEAFFVEEIADGEEVPEEAHYHPFYNKRSMSTSEIVGLECAVGRMSRDTAVKSKDVSSSSARKRREAAAAARCRSVDSFPHNSQENGEILLDKDDEDTGAVSDSEIESRYTKRGATESLDCSRNNCNHPQLPPSGVALMPCLSDSVLHMPDAPNNGSPCVSNLQDMNLSWNWGELPSDMGSPPVQNSYTISTCPVANSRHMNSGAAPTEPLHVATSHEDSSTPSSTPPPAAVNRSSAGTDCPVGDGIYLQDLIEAKTDEQVKKAYIYTHGVESRRGGKESLVRFSSLETLYQQQDAGYRSDGEGFSSSPVPTTPPYPVVRHMRLSLCGNLTQDSVPSTDVFLEHLVSYEEFMKDPERILSDANLVVQMNERYLPWAVVAPMLVSIVGYQTELAHSVTKRLEEQHIPKSRARRKTWFSWGASKAPEPPVAIPSTQPANSTEQPTKASPATPVTTAKVDLPLNNTPTLSFNSTCLEDDTFRMQLENTEQPNPPPADTILKLTKCYKKVNRLSSDKIKKLNLHEGYNEIEYRVITRWQGTARCKAAIYLWNWHDAVVISDVDGTITRSDVLGHVFPLLGRDWTQIGVARLYHKIEQNGYRFVYLTARAIGQSEVTRRYLTSLVQEEKMQLPRGPILLSPNSLLHAFHREVIERKPEVFKVQCLQDLRQLFPCHLNPFFAGFGNRPSDVFTYLTVGIPDCRIFTVDSLGQLYTERTQGRKTNFKQLTDLVDFVFSARSGREPRRGSVMFDDEVDTLKFSSYCYWKDPLPPLDSVL